MTEDRDPLDRIEEWARDTLAVATIPHASDVLALVAVARAAREVTTKQQECLESFRSHGIVFNDIGNDPTNWQHVAFTIYSDLCEAEAGCRAALARLEERS